MATCAYCGLTILFGGKRVNEVPFCSDKCAAKGHYLVVADRVPREAVAELASQLHRGPCPKCQGPGPVDVHRAYIILSMLELGAYESQAHVVCRKCGTKAQVSALLSSLAFGWWSLPGIILTPVQIGRNIAALRRESDPTQPSEELVRFARLQLARLLPAAQ